MRGTSPCNTREDFIVIICPTLRYNKSQSWVWNDPDVIPIEPGNQLYYLIEKISNLLAGDNYNHRGHSLWLLTQ